MNLRHLHRGTWLCILSTPAAAHPGHGRNGGSFQLWHYLAEPVHAAGLALLGAVVVAILFTKKRANGKRRRPQ